ncbi:LuxR family transcriptional regulator [Pseudonocardia eucalypti]|uniref:LuxR family transcriptional regulator n=1 Tax=Pseudonocardia eucalypti TaxID=648755 RepID=A0ABP9QCM7_9PSEU|nr:DNA-binding CsgD family transcriptional regulator [Pseudonocardia eucalypti]
MAEPLTGRDVPRGRTAERAAIRAFLDKARAGTGGALVLRGEPGIGKSTLLDDSAEQANGMRVLRTAGVEPERDLGHATMHRLLQPLLEGIGGLPPAQATALDTVFGRRTDSEDPAPDRFLVALATLTLLSDAARARPLLCLIDDAHWADQPSVDALLFAARRVGAEPIAFLIATRSADGEHGGFPSLPELRLTGLDRGSARELLREHAGGSLAPTDEELLLRTAAGNPLALRELPASLPPGGPRGAPLPLVDRLQETFAAQLHRLSDPARELLLLAAADGSGQLSLLRRAATEDLEPALDELRGLLVVDPHSVRFRHPLVRSAVFHAASLTRRKAAHLALAAALGSQPAQSHRRAWHLGQGTDGPDEAVAAELERAAEQENQRAGPAAAATALVRAAELSPPGPDQARRLVEASIATWRSGDATRAVQRLEAAERLDTHTPDTRIRVTMLRALIALRAGDPTDTLHLLQPFVRAVPMLDPTSAVEVLMLYGEASYHAGAPGAWRDIIEAVENLPLAGDEPDVVLLRLTRALGRVGAGTPPPALSDTELGVLERLTDSWRLCWAGALFWGLGDLERCRRLRRRALERANALGAVSTIACVLVFVVADEIAAGRFQIATGLAEDGRQHAADTGQPNLVSWFDSALAALAGLAGGEAATRELADRVLAEPVRRGLVTATLQARQALGLVELAAGRAEQALQYLRPLDAPDTTGHPGLVGFMLSNVPDLVEAAYRLGQPELAAEPLGRFVRWTETTGSPEQRALATRCQALVGTNEAEKAFRRALDLHPVGEQPVVRARTQLLYGEYLRRARRRGDARPLLRAALESFEHLGAKAWAERARDELRATGETPTNPTRDTLTTLTPQELRIARAAAEGATNREIAAQLFVSPRTIDYHLRKIFQKTGITSRVELILLTLPNADQPSGS